MAGDAKANKANSNNRQGVQLSKSAAASVKDMQRIKGMTGQARKTAEAVLRRKRKNAAVLAQASRR